MKTSFWIQSRSCVSFKLELKIPVLSIDNSLHSRIKGTQVQIAKSENVSTSHEPEKCFQRI